MSQLSNPWSILSQLFQNLTFHIFTRINKKFQTMKRCSKLFRDYYLFKSEQKECSYYWSELICSCWKKLPCFLSSSTLDSYCTFIEFSVNNSFFQLNSKNFEAYPHRKKDRHEVFPFVENTSLKWMIWYFQEYIYIVCINGIHS